MASTRREHHELVNGVGKCSVPMWCMGLPADFCNADAYGPQRKPYSWETYPNHLPYCSGLACPNHGGPNKPLTNC